MGGLQLLVLTKSPRWVYRPNPGIPSTRAFLRPFDGEIQDSSTKGSARKGEVMHKHHILIVRNLYERYTAARLRRLSQSELYKVSVMRRAQDGSLTAIAAGSSRRRAAPRLILSGSQRRGGSRALERHFLAVPKGLWLQHSAEPTTFSILTGRRLVRRSPAAAP
jgi:hypothetical protein